MGCCNKSIRPLVKHANKPIEVRTLYNEKVAKIPKKKLVNDGEKYRA